MEFNDLDSERRFFERHSVPIDEVVIEIPLSPGELLVFDNLALAHEIAEGRGNRASYTSGCLARAGSQSRANVSLRDAVLGAFHTPVARLRSCCVSPIGGVAIEVASAPECRTAFGCY